MASCNCPVCGHTFTAPTVARKRGTVAVYDFPPIMPTDSARTLHAAHVATRDTRRKRSAKRGKHEHPTDHTFRVAHPDVVRFLNEAYFGGRVERWYAADDQSDAVTVWLTGPGGAFDGGYTPHTYTVDQLRMSADVIADGSVAYRQVRRLAAVA